MMFKRFLTQFKNKIKNINVTFAGIVVITAIFGIYLITTHNTNNNPSVADKIKDALTREGTITPEAAKDDRRDELAEGERPEVAGAHTEPWIATDYVSGDITQGDYTVKKGDTLWEIAEAVYGDGNQWHKILEKNKDSIGYLPNGSQALIIPGQTLVLP